MHQKIVDSSVLLLKGAVIGVANIIPGVSGGTLAVVLGIYDRLIEAITGFFEDPAKRLENSVFLVKIFLGAGIAILLLANLMEYLLAEHIYMTMFMFMGLILGGIPVLITTHGDMGIKPPRAASFLLGFCVVVGFTLLGDAGRDSTSSHVALQINGVAGYIMLFLGGFLAGGAMIVPGLSGSFILVLMGQYALIISSIKSLSVRPLALVAIGAFCGIFTFSKIIKLCLEKIPSVTYYFILGLIVASFYKLFPGVPSGGIIALGCLIVFALGAGISYSLSKLS